MGSARVYSLVALLAGTNPAVSYPTIFRAIADAMTIGGTSVDPGDDVAAEINAIIGAGGTAVLGPGTYGINAPLVFGDGGAIIGAGEFETTIQLLPGVSDGNVDSSANAALRVLGVLEDAVMDTTLAAVLPMGARAFSVVDAGTLQSGDWVAIEGHNDGATDIPGMSSGENITLREIVQTTDVTGNALTLGSATAQHHTVTNGGSGTPQSVKAVVPVIGVTIAGLTLDATGLDDMAVGVQARYAANSAIRVAGKGFTRAVCEQTGTRDVVAEVSGHGTNNAVLISDSQLLGTARVASRALTGELYAAQGVIRGAFTLTGRTSLCVISGDVADVSWGSWIAGGIGNTTEYFRAENTDLTEARTRAGGEGANVLASGYQQGSGVIADGEVGFSNIHNAITCINTRQDVNDQAWVSCMFHDNRDAIYGPVVVHNDGASPGTAPYQYGLRIQDVTGTIESVDTKGCSYALQATGSILDVRISAWYQDARAGTAPNAIVGLAMRYNVLASGQASIGLRIAHARIANTFLPLYLSGTPWDGGIPDWDFWIDDVEIEGERFHDVTVAYNNAGTAFVKYDAVQQIAGATAKERYLQTAPAAGSRAPCVVVEPVAGTNWCFVGQLPSGRAWVMADAGTFNPGDSVEVKGGLAADATSRMVQVDNTKSPGLCGRVLIGKTGAAAKIAVGMPAPSLDGPSYASMYLSVAGSNVITGASDWQDVAGTFTAGQVTADLAIDAAGGVTNNSGGTIVLGCTACLTADQMSGNRRIAIRFAVDGVAVTGSPGWTNDAPGVVAQVSTTAIVVLPNGSKLTVQVTDLDSSNTISTDALTFQGHVIG